MKIRIEHSSLLNEKKWFISCLNNESLVKALRAIKLVICDVDGTLTDGGLFLFPGIAEELKTYSVIDGYGIEQAIKKGLNVGFLSGKNGTMVELRASRLGICAPLVVLGKSGDKSPYVKAMQDFCKVTREQTLFFGDDVQDLTTRASIALFASPASALFYIADNADIFVPRNAGYGAVRLLLDLILYVQGRHFAHEVIEKAL